MEPDRPALLPQTQSEPRQSIGSASLSNNKRFSIDVIAAILFTLGAVGLHLHEWLSAGGLWRDEVNSVVLCQSSSIRVIWDNLQYDSFPMLWHLCLRTVLATGLCTTALRIRAFGLLCGLCIILVQWKNARTVGSKTPLLELFLLQCTSAVILFGDSIRGHGLGIIFGLLLFGFAFDLAMSGGKLRTALTLIVAVLSVHETFYNCITVLACCCGGMAVDLALGNKVRAAIIASIGFVAGVSMLAYVPVIHRAQRFMMLVQVHWYWKSAFRSLSLALNPLPDGLPFSIPGLIWPTVWLVVVASVVIATPLLIWPALQSRTARSLDRHQCAWLYGWITLIVFIPAYLAFLHSMHYLVQPWYFISGFSIVAACCGPLGSTLLNGRHRFRVTAVILVIAASFAPALWSNTGLAKTNIDGIDAALRTLASPGDIVIAEPWHYAVSIQYYDANPATVMPWPPVHDFRFLKYDQLFPFMTGDAPLAEPKAQLLAALQAGHTIWVIAQPPVESGPSNFDKAPRAGTGWWSGYYERVWAQSLNGFLTSTVNEMSIMELHNGQTDTPTLSYESPVLLRCTGLKAGGRR